MTKQRMPDPTSDCDGEVDELSGRVEACHIEPERCRYDNSKDAGDLVKGLSQLDIGCEATQKLVTKSEVSPAKQTDTQEDGKKEEKEEKTEEEGKKREGMVQLDASNLKYESDNEDNDTDSAHILKSRGPSHGLPAQYQYAENYAGNLQTLPQTVVMPTNFPNYSTYSPRQDGHFSNSCPKRGIEVQEMYHEPPKFYRPPIEGENLYNNLNNLNASDSVGQKKTIIYHKQMSGGTMFTPEHNPMSPEQIVPGAEAFNSSAHSLQRMNSLGLGSLDAMNIPVGEEFNVDDFLPDSLPNESKNSQPPAHQSGYPSALDIHTKPATTHGTTSATSVNPNLYMVAPQQTYLHQQQYRALPQSTGVHPQYSSQTKSSLKTSSANFDDHGYESDRSPLAQEISVASPDSLAHSPPSNQAHSPPYTKALSPLYIPAPPCTNYSPPPSNSSCDSGIDQDECINPQINNRFLDFVDAVDFVYKDVEKMAKDERNKKAQNVPRIDGIVLPQTNQPQTTCSPPRQAARRCGPTNTIPANIQLANLHLTSHQPVPNCQLSNQGINNMAVPTYRGMNIAASTAGSGQVHTPINTPFNAQLNTPINTQRQPVTMMQGFGQPAATLGLPVSQATALVIPTTASIPAVTNSTGQVINKDGKIAIPRLPSTESRAEKGSNIVLLMPCQQTPPANQVTSYVPIRPKAPSQPTPSSSAGSPCNMAASRQETISKRLNLARRVVAEMKTEDIKHIDADGDTYLHIAISDVEIDQNMVQALLERLQREDLTGMIDKQNNMGQTPLYLAVTTNNPDKVRCLLNYNANPNLMADRIKSTGARQQLAAIHCASSLGAPYLDTLTALLKARSLDINLVDSDGNTGLNCAILEHGKSAPGGNINSFPVITELMAAHSDPEKQTNGKTALMLVLESGKLDLIEHTFGLVDSVKMAAFLKSQSCVRIARDLKTRLNEQGQLRLHAALKASKSGQSSPLTTPPC